MDEFYEMLRLRQHISNKRKGTHTTFLIQLMDAECNC